LPRGTLSADQILDAAGGLAVRRGIETFTMPELAQDLAVNVTSLYWHFRTKDELVVALADRATRQFYAGLEHDEDLKGDDRVLEHFRLYWRRLRVNPLWREVFINSFTRTTSGSLEAWARGRAVWRRGVSHIIDAGLSPSDAGKAYAILSAYTRGYVLVQQRLEEDVEATRHSDQGLLADLDAFPHLKGAEVTPDPDETFEIGLRALWAGLSAGARSNTRAAPARTPRRSAKRSKT
jgi:AcrR family transcriptional regulator